MRQLWQPFSPAWNRVQQLQTEMNRLFDRWGDNGTRGLSAAYPAVNIWEDAQTVFVEAELPGVDPKDLEIHVTAGNQLALKGQRKQIDVAKGVAHRQERGFGAFSRILTLPVQVNADKVDAKFDNGVLLLKLPKHESAKPRKILVKAE